jgi:predicted dehydrogenase
MVVRRKSDSALQRYPQARIVRQVEEVFEDSSVELVIVNTPNEFHFSHASRALEAGKHVIVEKPFTITTKEADKLIQLAREKNKIISVFQNRRWDGDFLTVKEVLQKGLVGRIVEIEMHYDRYRNYIEMGTWKEEKHSGTGILYNLGSHLLDQILVLVGMPKEVDARIGIQRTGGQVEDYYDIRLIYEGFHAIIKSSYLVREQGPRFILHGTEGSFIKYGLDPQEQALKEGKTPGAPGWGVDDKINWGKLNTTLGGLHVEGLIETIPGNYLVFYQNIYAAIREGKPLLVNPEESRKGVQLIEACYESNRTKKSVAIQ